MNSKLRISAGKVSRVGSRTVISFAALLSGVLLFSFISDEAYDYANDLAQTVLSNRIAVIIGLLVLLELCAFSQLGAFAVPVLDCVFGFVSALCVSLAVSSAELSVSFVFKVFFAVLCIFTAAVFISSGAFSSSYRLFMRTRHDDKLAPELLKLLLLGVCLTAFLIFGVPKL